MVIRELTGAQLRIDRGLQAHTITCARCAYCLLIGRGDRAALLISLGDLQAAGWRASGRLALCPTCVPLARAEASDWRASGRLELCPPRAPAARAEAAARAPAAPADPSIARTALRQYAYRATGETRQWALTLLREWGG